MFFAGLGTWTVALIALFGDLIRSRWNRPHLTVELISDHGEPQPQIIRWQDEAGITRQRTRDSRCYRLRITNGNRRGPAHEVHLVVESMTRPGLRGGHPICGVTRADTPSMGARRSIPGYQECRLSSGRRSAGGDLRSNARSPDGSRDEGLRAWGRLTDYSGRSNERVRQSRSDWYGMEAGILARPR
jgi:hypothetical protein